MQTDHRGEFELIDAIRAALGPVAADVVVGIGDDAAVLAVPSGHELVVTTDLLVEGRHFAADPDVSAAGPIGWKSLAVSVSDLAAMGARARWAVVSVALRRDLTGAFADALTEGLRRCADEYGVSIVGGDTTASPGPLVVNVTLHGTVPRGGAILRSGARPGDAICVTGALGGSLLGRHLHVLPRQEEALSLVQQHVVHAMIDLSDGLSSDLGHVLEASGVAAELWADRIPVHADAVRRAASTGQPALEHALHDGEDFELLFTTTETAAHGLVESGIGDTPVAHIGRITGRSGSAACRLASHAGGSDGVELVRGGHDHFRHA